MRWILIVLACCGLSAQTLTPALENWKRDIEKAGVPLLIAGIDYDASTHTFSLPPDTEGATLFAGYLQNQDFLLQFQNMYGVMVHHKEPREAYLVMLNKGRAGEWKGQEEALLGHEFGHAWIKSRQFPTPVFQPGLAGCLAIHTGDIAQHVLIRKELDARGIDHKTAWIRALDQAVQKPASASSPPEEDRCIRVRQTAELVDVRLGLAGVDWKGREAYEAKTRKVFPEVQPTVDEIVGWMRGHDMEDVDQHRQTLRFVFEKLKALAYGRSPAYIL